MNALSLGETSIVLIGAFLIAFVGYEIGSISFKGIKLGTAGVFLSALLFGYLFTIPGIKDFLVIGNFYVENASSSIVTKYKFMESIGLILFVTSVGFMAGPTFFKDLKKNAKSYVPISAIIIVLGALLAVAFAVIPGIGSAYSTGVLSGAITSTPGFSAAKAVASDEGLVALGHAVAYPFGVVSVVLFVQIVPRVLKSNMVEERKLITVRTEEEVKEGREKKKGSRMLDRFGFGAFSIAVILGVLLGAIRIPLSGEGYNGLCFTLGNTGGPLLMAVILGHFGRIGKLNMEVPARTLQTFRELGLMLFLIGAGVEGGVELVSQIQASVYGPMLVLYGLIAAIVMKMIPMLVGYFMAKKVFKLPLLNALGSICGGMTSTPALGTLVNVAGTEDVASAYASTYPVSLVLIVIACNLICTFFA